MTPLEGLANIRTSLRQHIHSLPPTHRSPYLERHILAKEKERLEKEIAFLERRCQRRRQQLADVEAQLEALAQQDKPASAAVSSSAKRENLPDRLAKMTVEY